MNPVIMDSAGMHRTVIRLSHEIEERNEGLHDVVLVGIKRGGEILANRICNYFKKAEGVDVPCGGIDIGLTRDDLVSAFFVPEVVKNELGFDVAGKKVVLCDDVLHTGRSAVAAMEALFKLGRPDKIQLLALVDRGGRELPVRADFVGKNVPTSHAEYVRVKLKELGADEDGLTITRESK